MIRPININLNAAHPELPLAEAVTYTGSPSTVLIRGVPPNCGRWAITAVFVAASFPDGSTTTRAAVQSANGVWVATLPATATSGRAANGVRIMADGIDENGEAVTGYILGVADFAVASLGVTPAPEPGETSYQMLYFDAAPSTLRKGDVAKIDGVLKYYNGTTWLPFTDLSNYYTKAETDNAIDKLAAYYITADAQGNPFATHAALVNAQTYYSGGAARIPTRNDYAVVSADETHGGAEWRYIYSENAQGVGQWEPQYAVEGVIAYDNTVTPSSANGVKSSGIWSAIWGALTALPTGFSSLYDWCVSQLAGKVGKTGDTMTGGLTVPNLTVGSRKPNTTVGTKSVAEGNDVEASDNYSHAEGTGTVAQNFAEHAQGMYNVSHRVGPMPGEPGNTLSSIGFGITDSTRKNAVETMQDGKTFIYGLGGYDGTNPTATGVKDLATAVNTKLDSTSAAPAFSTSSTYAVGDHVTYNGALYRCTTAVTTAGAWDASKWTADMASNYFQYALVAKTIDNGAVTLDDRAINAVAVSSSLASLTVNFPTATTGKARDFAMRLNIAAGVTAPEIAWPQGVTLENDGGEVPEIADGGTGGSSTILYFSETENNGTTAKFLVKGEALTAITQA